MSSDHHEARVTAVVASLTEEEKVAVGLGDWTPLESRGLPGLSYVDAGTGLRDVPGATAFPVGVSLAATFDPDLAERYGSAVGAEVRTAGFSVLLGPTLDLARNPRGGRVPEAFGEDPCLAGLIGAAHVRGVQSHHVIAQLKHFVAYNGEERRTGHGPLPVRGDAIDVLVGDAVLHDVYLRPFQAAIEAGAWSMMGSYNRINGEYACQSAEILRIPRDTWGWGGFYCPDFLFAVRDDAKALAAGLDVAALGGPAGRTAELLTSPALPDGTLDTLVTRVVRAIVGSGLADHPLPAPPGPTAPAPSTEEHRAIAHETAVRGAVLLRNERPPAENPVLPLADDVRTIAVIGPSGHDAIYVGGGAAAVTLTAERVVTPLAGLQERAARALGNLRVVAVQGSLGDAALPLAPDSAFTLPDGSGSGVQVERVGPGGPTTEVVPRIDLGPLGIEDLRGAWPARWRTLLTPDRSGPHRLSLTLGGRATVRLDGTVVMTGSRELERFFGGPVLPLQCVVPLEAGRPVLLEIDYEFGPAIVVPPAGLGPTLRLGLQPPDTLLDDAAAAAAEADVAVVLVNAASGEGMDRDALALPGDQDELVRRVAAVNPRAVVVLNTPGAVLMPWLDDVAAVLQVWYPGERFGSALAAVLFGDQEPGGRLPLTFPRDPADLPGHGDGPAVTPTLLDYAEGPAIGYRAGAVLERGALFPFGFGLSYAETDHTAELFDGETGDADGAGARLTVQATNRSPRAAVHVVQFYAELHADLHPTGDRELVGVCRVPLPPLGSAEATTVVPAGWFARWAKDTGRRVPADGRHVLSVATSSADPGTAFRVSVRNGEVRVGR